MDALSDLNLLVSLDALLAERHVTRAAARVGVTQSAMSHALSRLRAATGDALLVRVAGGMALTAHAEALEPRVRGALAAAAAALARPEPFDPRVVSKRFAIGTSDYVEMVVLPRLMSSIAARAPNVELRMRTLHDDLASALASGKLDVAVMPKPDPSTAGLHARRLFEDRFVCVVRAENPIAKRRLTLRRFVEASHVLIAPRETEGGFVDDALARRGLTRKVALAVPHFMVAPHVVAATDHVLTLAERVADVIAAPLGLTVLAPPPELELKGFTMYALWHARSHHDPAQQWLRDQLVAASKS